MCGPGSGSLGGGECPEDEAREGVVCLWRILSWGRGRYGGEGAWEVLATQDQKSVDSSSEGSGERTEPRGVSCGRAGVSHKQMEAPCMWQKEARNLAPPPSEARLGCTTSVGAQTAPEKVEGRAAVPWERTCGSDKAGGGGSSQRCGGGWWGSCGLGSEVRRHRALCVCEQGWGTLEK